MELYQWMIDSAGKWGLGIVLSILLFFLFRKVLSRVLDSFTEERNIYIDLLKDKNMTIDNHIDHMTKSNDRLYEILSELRTNVVVQKECMDKGFVKVVDAIKDQTTILSDRLKNN